MSETYWWSNIGSFQPWKKCPSRPDAAEVLHFYMEKRDIGSDEQVAYLSDLLDLKKSMVYNILKGEGLDSISRCRVLVQALKIYPPLLGIDAKYYPIERHAYWWHSYGFFFNADAQGYPVMSEVVAYLRMQRTLVEDGGRVKVWSQEDLGDATGLKKETVYRTEHQINPFVLESMSRRAIVASALGTLTGDQESTIFRLFGLDPQAYRVPVPAHESVPVINISTQILSDELLQRYHRQQKAFFTEYYTCHGQNSVGEALEWMKQLPTLMPQANTNAQRISLLALQSRNHRLLACIAREQCQKECVIFHTERAVELAEQTMNLPDPKLGNDRAQLLITKELLAAALLTTATAYYELEQYDLAQEYINRALNFLPTVQSSQLKRHILADAGLIHAYTATTPTDQTLVLSYFDLAAQIPLRANIPDDNLLLCGNDMLYIRKAMALISPKMKGATAVKVLDLLNDAQRLSNHEMIRQQVIIEVLQARTYFTEGSYWEATEIALSALEKCSLIRSRLNRDRIEGLYHQLLDTTFRGKPLLAHLGVKLRTWDHDMN